MVSMDRIMEVYRFYVYHESSNEPDSIKRFETLRTRFAKIIEANKRRSIQLAMGSNTLPFQNIINKMTDEEFEEFIDDNITGKRRKEIFNKY